MIVYIFDEQTEVGNMKLRKLFAWLMSLIMLMGMVPVGHAELAGCNHDWDSGKWLRGEPRNCLDWKPKTYTCTICGATATNEECGPCQPGSWHWDGNPPANCNEWGIQNQSCSVCGEVFNEREVRGDHKWGGFTTVEPAGCETPGEEVSNCSVCGERGSSREIPAKGHDWGDWKWEVEATCNKEGLRVRYCKRCNLREEDYAQGGNHQWGEWITTVEPTCMEQGRHQHTCKRCGAAEWEYIPKADHVFGDWRVVEEPQVGLPGYERRFCVYQCGTYEERMIPPLEQDADTPVGAAAPTLTLALSSTPANGEYFVVGEQVVFTETWANNTNQTLTPFSVSIWTCNTPVFGSAVDQLVSRWFSDNGPVVPGATGSHALTVTVTEADVVRGAIYAMAELSAAVQSGDYLADVRTPFVTARCGQSADSGAGLTITWTYTNAPANGSFFVPGEVVDYMATITNTGSVPLNALSVGADVTMAQIPSVSTIAPGQTIICRYNDLLEESDVQSGSMTSKAYVTGYTTGEPTMEGAVDAVSAPVTVPVGKGDITPAVYYHKTVINAPANGSFFTEGETIEYKLSLINNGKKDIYSITLKDPMANTRSVAYARKLVAGDVLQGTFTYVVTAADVANGQVSNTATSTWEAKANGILTTTPSNTVVTPCGSDNSGDFDLSAALSVTKAVTGTPSNGSYYEPGVDITFVITVSNRGVKPLLNVNVIDPLGGGLVTVLETLNVGETRNITVVFTTTDLVAWAGSVDNGACVKAVDQDGRQYVEYSNIVTVPCGHTFNNVTMTPDNPFGIFHSLSVVKKEESLPLNGQFYTEGEVIHYSITYTNDGELPLTDVQVWDTMDINTTIGHAETLQPGESRTCYYQHTVTAADVDTGIVLNMAQANYPIPGGEGYMGVNSNLVSSKTSIDGMHCVVLPPLFPEDGEDPDYDPGTGWFPPEEESETPSFGTIDTDKLHSGDNYCVRTITGRDNVSVSCDTAFCSVHSPIQSSMLLMTQAAVTPEMQEQTAAYAVALWRTEVDALYQELFTAADPIAKATVMTEYIRFLTEVANYEALLKNLHPDQPALVAKKIASMWEDKCVTLCYEMHTTTAQRKDSLLSVTPAAGAVASECACTTTDEVNGKKAYTQSYCPVHGFPFGMIDMLLQGQDTAEAWTMVRQIWRVELSNAYNKAAAKLGANSALAMAEYNALTQWMMAREASLIALYPENPEVVVQTMVKLIMDRVNDLCQVTK